MFFLKKTSTIHIELLLRNAPVKNFMNWPFLVWFAGLTPDFFSFSSRSPMTRASSWNSTENLKNG